MQSRVLETPHTAQGAATFRRALDIRDDHPAKIVLTGLCAERFPRLTGRFCCAAKHIWHADHDRSMRDTVFRQYLRWVGFVADMSEAQRVR